MDADDRYTTHVWYHGTNSNALPDILANGLTAQPVKPLIERVEDAYGLRRDSIWNHPVFCYSRDRDSDPYTYLSDDRSDAEFYARSGPEVLQDALRAVYQMTVPDEGGAGIVSRARVWAEEQAPRFIGEPIVLQIAWTVPMAGHHHRVKHVPAGLITVIPSVPAAR